jgi:concanavalin A-like lectin/glucanase superfamily protein
MRALTLAFMITALVAFASVSQAGVAFFDDVTDTIEVSGQTVFGTAATYEAIVLWPSAHGGGGSTLFNEWQDFVEDKYLAVVPGPSGGLYGYNHPVNGGSVITGATPVSFDQWHHVAFVYDGSEERLYLDGTLVQSRPASGDISDGDGLGYVGGIYRDGAARDSFIGLIDVLRLSDVARYTGSSFTPPSPAMTSDANTVLLYTFDDAPGSTTVADASSLARTGTLGAGFGGATSPILCGDDPTDADGDFIPDSCDPDPPASTSTTTTIATTTTTTTLAGCDGIPVGPTFASIDCRLDALLTHLNAAPALGDLAAKLAHTVDKARQRKVDAEALCRTSNAKKTRKRLQQATKELTLYVHRLNGLAARKKLDPAVRQQFVDEGTPIQRDLRMLRAALRCPDDAPPA